MMSTRSKKKCRFPLKRQIPFALSLLISALAKAGSNPGEANEISPEVNQTAAAAPAMQKVEVKGTVYDARREDVGTRIVVKQEELTRFGTSSLTETLTRLPGITVTNTGAIAMRGLGKGYVQILLNGEPLPAGFSLDTLAPELIDHVEVLRTSTADVGVQAVAGTINVVLKKESKAEQRELKGGTQAGRGQRESSLSLQRAGQDGAWAYALAMSGSLKLTRVDWSDDYSNFDGNGVVDQLQHNARFADRHQSVVSLAPRIAYKLDGGGTVALQSFLNGERIWNTLHSQTQTLLGNEPEHSIEHSRYDDHNWMFRNDLMLQRPLDDSAKLDMKIGQTTSRRGTDFKEDGYLSDGRQNWATLVTSRIHEQGWNSTGKYTNSLFGAHAVAFGWDGRRTTRSENRIEHALAFPGVPALDTDQEYSAAIMRLALYAQEEWSPGGGLSVYVGLRWEGLKTRSEGNGFAPIRNRSSIFFPVMQTLWKVPGSANDQVRAALTRTFNPPEVVKLIPRLYTSFNNTPVYPDREGNPALRPEVAAGLDIAYEHYWANKAMASIGLYGREIKDFIREDVSLIGERWLATNVNAGKAHTRGIEFDTKLPLRAVYASAPDLDLSMNLTRNWSSVDGVPGPHNRLSQQTRLSGTAALDYRSPDRTLSAGASFRFKDGGPVRVAYNEAEYSSVVRTLDMFVAWKFMPKTQARLSMLNLLGQPSWITYSYLGATRRLDLRETHPTRAAVRLNIEHQF